MRYMMCFGGLYEMKNQEYRTFLENRAAGFEVEVPGKLIDRSVLNVTDMTQHDAKLYLGTMTKRPQ